MLTQNTADDHSTPALASRPGARGRRRHQFLSDWFTDHDLLADTQRHEVTMITRLRLDAALLDAALYEPAPPRLPHTLGRPRKKGERLPKLEERLLDPSTEWQRVKAT